MSNSSRFAIGDLNEIGLNDVVDWSAGLLGFESGITRPAIHVLGILKLQSELLINAVSAAMPFGPKCFIIIGDRYTIGTKSIWSFGRLNGEGYGI